MSSLPKHPHFVFPVTSQICHHHRSSFLASLVEYHVAYRSRWEPRIKFPKIQLSQLFEFQWGVQGMGWVEEGRTSCWWTPGWCRCQPAAFAWLLQTGFSFKRMKVGVAGQTLVCFLGKPNGGAVFCLESKDLLFAWKVGREGWCSGSVRMLWPWVMYCSCWDVLSSMSCASAPFILSLLCSSSPTEAFASGSLMN